MTMDGKQEATDRKAVAILSKMIDIEGKPIRRVASELGVNPGLIPYVLNGGHSPTLLDALNLPVYEQREVTVCLDCGNVHTMHKTCAPTRRKQVRFRKSADMQSRDEQEALEQIAKINGFEGWTDMCRFMAQHHLGGFRVSISCKAAGQNV